MKPVYHSDDPTCPKNVYRMKMCPWGEFTGRDGVTEVIDWEVFSNLQKSLCEHQAKGQDIFLDIEHASCPSEGETPLPAASRAAGWVKVLVPQPEGIYADIEATNGFGDPLISNEQYKYLSAVWDRIDNKPFNLVSITLTNTPWFSADNIVNASGNPDMTTEQKSVKPRNTMKKNMKKKTTVVEEFEDGTIEAVETTPVETETTIATEKKEDLPPEDKVVTDQVTELAGQVDKIVESQIDNDKMYDGPAAQAAIAELEKKFDTRMKSIEDLIAKLSPADQVEVVEDIKEELSESESEEKPAEVKSTTKKSVSIGMSGSTTKADALAGYNALISQGADWRARKAYRDKHNI